MQKRKIYVSNSNKAFYTGFPACLHSVESISNKLRPKALRLDCIKLLQANYCKQHTQPEQNKLIDFCSHLCLVSTPKL